MLQPHVTEAITSAFFTELAEHGYGRLSLEAVAKRAGVGRGALYRRWPSKQDLILALLSDFSVPLKEVADTGSLRTDLRAELQFFHDWLTHPRFAAILPELSAEAARSPEVATALDAAIGTPRREIGAVTLRRGIARGELPDDLDLDLAFDMIVGPAYWRVNIRRGEIGSGYVERMTEFVLRALGAMTIPTSSGEPGPRRS